MINSSLHQLLNQLGFETRYTPLGGDMLGYWCGSRVSKKKCTWIAETPPFFEPVRLESDPEQVSQYAGIEVRLRQGMNREHIRTIGMRMVG